MFRFEMLKRSTPMRSRKKAASAAEKRHMDRVAAKGCCVPECGAPATIHHVTGYADRMGRFSRSNEWVVPLCPQHHQAVYDSASMPVSVERLGHRGFYQEHGIDLLAEAERLWAETEEIEAERRAA